MDDTGGLRRAVWATGTISAEVLTQRPRCLPWPPAKWKFPSGPAHRGSRASLHPGRGEEDLATGSAGCSAPSAPPCPAWAPRGRKTALRSHLLSAVGPRRRPRTSARGRDFHYRFRAGCRNPPLTAVLQRGGRRSGGSVPGPAAKLSSGLHRASKHVRRSGPAW